MSVKCVAGVLVAVLVGAAASCSVDKGGEPAAQVMPARPAGEAIEAEPLHNVIVFGDGVLSGSAPAGEASFDALREMGVRTVISVDAMRPDVERASAREMRYIHVPVEYATIDPEERATLARALREAPRPIYVHCHHGVHRGPAAAALALVTLGEISAAEGEALMRRAGTSDKYAGLYSCVQGAGPMPAAAVEAMAGPLVAVADVGDMAGAMAKIDRAWDHLKLLRESGWRATEAHPDLDPLAEAGELHDLLRAAGEIEDERVGEEAFAAEWEESVDASALLEALLERGAGEAALGEQMARLSASCGACHDAYRQ